MISSRTSGLIGGFHTVVAEEGIGALATGLGATAFGYFIQGWFKFGGIERKKLGISRPLSTSEHLLVQNSLRMSSSVRWRLSVFALYLKTGALVCQMDLARC